uniref:Putative tail protein n=1 Tax=viral metagenome TaxID=1070528 RepID=A0A6H1ZEC4_9ZZZZ
MRYYSKTTGATYLDGRHAAMPVDAVAISEARYMDVIGNPAAGKIRSHDSEGLPFLIDPPVHEPSPDDIERDLTAVLNRHLDAVAGQRRYDSRFTCSLRAGFPGPFQEEGRVFAAWMDACNMAAYQLMADVKAGSRAVPTEAELIVALPVIEWPPSPIPAGAA